MRVRRADRNDGIGQPQSAGERIDVTEVDECLPEVRQRENQRDRQVDGAADHLLPVRVLRLRHDGRRAVTCAARRAMRRKSHLPDLCFSARAPRP